MNHTRPTVTEEPLLTLRHVCEECGEIIGNTVHDRPDKGMCARCWKACHD